MGSIDSDVKAARIYDLHAIMSHGLRAKTNFTYTKEQILKMIQNESEGLELDESFEHHSNDDGSLTPVEEPALNPTLIN
jgi:hypothetical protein